MEILVCQRCKPKDGDWYHEATGILVIRLDNKEAVQSLCVDCLAEATEGLEFKAVEPKKAKGTYKKTWKCPVPSCNGKMFSGQGATKHKDKHKGLGEWDPSYDVAAVPEPKAVDAA